MTTQQAYKSEVSIVDIPEVKSIKNAVGPRALKQRTRDFSQFVQVFRFAILCNYATEYSND